MQSLSLRAVNTLVYSVHGPDGLHVGNLKRIGDSWKFKAVGYEADGAVVPGGGPFTHRHNTLCDAPDVVHVNAKLGA